MSAEEALSRVAEKLGGGRSGAIVSKALAGSPGAPADGGRPGGEGEGASGLGRKVLRSAGAAVAKMTDIEAALTAPIGAVPTAALPALTCWMPEFGLPHAHGHPPNLTPPNPVPVQLPSFGLVLQIPVVSGASHTRIGGAAAARCGDLGTGLWCGGYFPLFEVFLGSANVWIEGARAARMGIDVTKHCIFSTPKPTDPPLGQFFGITLMGAPNVLIGGFPLPSLTSLAMAQVFKAAFFVMGKAGGKFYRLSGLKGPVDKLVEKRAQAFVDKLVGPGSNVTLHGDARFLAAVRRNLVAMAKTRAGRKTLNELAGSGKTVNIVDMELANAWGHHPMDHGPVCVAHSPDGYVRIRPAANGEGQVVRHYNPSTRRWEHDYNRGPRVAIEKPGPGSGSNVYVDPAQKTPHSGVRPKSPSDVILAHELNHANNNAKGLASPTLGQPGGFIDNNQKFHNWEEHNTVRAENEYRSQRGDVPQREDYNELP